MDETYIKVKGVWKYLYRAMDNKGNTVDFLLTAKRDKAAAKRFFDKAMRENGAPEKVTMDKSGATTRRRSTTSMTAGKFRSSFARSNISTTSSRCDTKSLMEVVLTSKREETAGVTR